MQELRGLRAGHRQGQWGPNHHQVRELIQALDLADFLSSRLMTIEGNMNPKMSEVDIVPDDDLNTKLKFYVSDQTDTSTPDPILIAYA